MKEPDFSKLKDMCSTLDRISLEYEANSEERRALEAATRALGLQTMRDANELFEVFLKKHPLDEKKLSDWIAAHPEAPIGATPIIGAMLHVVTEDSNGQRRLVRVKPLSGRNGDSY